MLERAADYWRRHGLKLDPHLRDKAADGRRGLSLILRPGPAFAAAARPLLSEIAARIGPQYAYPAGDLHVTLLSLVSAQEGFRLDPETLERYRDCLRALFAAESAFAIDFSGLTASEEAILCKAESPAIGNLRDTLRQALRERGLSDTLDKRHRAESIHATLMRFTAPSPDTEWLVAFLLENASRPIFRAVVKEVQLVENDWYMTAAKVRVLETFPLSVV